MEPNAGMGSNATNISIRTVDTTVKVHAIVLLAVNAPITLLTIIGNGMFLITLFATRCLHTPSNMLLGALALSDLLVGTLGQPLWICKLSLTISGKDATLFHDISFIVMWALVLLSSIFIHIVSLDRYIAVCFPIWYHARATCKTHITAAVLALLACIVAYCTGYLVRLETKSSTVDKVYNSLVGILLLITGFYNFKVFIVVKRQRIQIRDSSAMENGRASPHRSQENYKALIIPIITLLFFACYCPMLLVEGVLELLHIFSKRDVKITRLWVEFLVLLNSVLNPVAYYVRMEAVREAAATIFCQTRRNVVQVP